MRAPKGSIQNVEFHCVELYSINIWKNTIPQQNQSKNLLKHGFLDLGCLYENSDQVPGINCHAKKKVLFGFKLPIF